MRNKLAVGVVCLSAGLLGSGAALAQNAITFGNDPFANAFWAATAPTAGTPPAVGAPPAVVRPAPAPAATQPQPAPAPARPAPAAVAPAPAPAPPPPQVAQAAPPPRPAPVPVQIVPPPPAPSAPTRARRFLGLDLDRTYLAGNLGWGQFQSADTSGAAGANTMEFGPGVAGSFAIGYRLGSLALESELAGAAAKVDTITPAGGAAETATGGVVTLALLVNAVYTFNLRWPISPYVLAGLGVARNQFRSVTSASMASTSDSTFNLAWQGGIGVDWPFGRHLSLDASYRLLSGGKPKLTNSAGDDFTTAVMVHNFLLGLRYRF